MRVKKKKFIQLFILAAIFLMGGKNVMAKETWNKPLGVMANGVENQVVISWDKRNNKLQSCLKEKSKRHSISV